MQQPMEGLTFLDSYLMVLSKSNRSTFAVKFLKHFKKI